MTFEVGCHRQRFLNAFCELKKRNLTIILCVCGYLHQRVCPPLDSFVAVGWILERSGRILRYLCTISPNKAFPPHQTLRHWFRHHYEGDQFHCCHLISMNVLIYSHNPYCYCNGCDNFDCVGFCLSLARIGIRAAPFHHEICMLVLQFSLIPN